MPGRQRLRYRATCGRRSTPRPHSAMFEILTSQNRYAASIASARHPPRRTPKIEQFVAMLARGETLHPQRRKLTE